MQRQQTDGDQKEEEWQIRTECYSQESALHKETDEQGMNRLLHPKSEGKSFQVGNEDGGRAGLQSLAGEFKENYLCLRL